jgi:hypothetical protein
MIQSIRSYVREEVVPHSAEIFCGFEMLLALGCAFVIGGFGHKILIANVKVGDVVTSLLTYAAIGLGFVCQV